MRVASSKTCKSVVWGCASVRYVTTRAVAMVCAQSSGIAVVGGKSLLVLAVVSRGVPPLPLTQLLVCFVR